MAALHVERKSPAAPGMSPGSAWLRAADAAVLLLILLSAWVLLSGGLRVTAGGIRISVTSAERLALLAAGVLAIRHAVWRRPSILATVRSLRPRAIPRAWAETAPAWAASRAGVILAGYFAVLLIGFPESGRPPRVSENALANLPARWDAFWYADIAINGYRWIDEPGRAQNVAFFPAFPLAMNIGGALLGAYSPDTAPTDEHLRVILGGWLAAIVAFWAALVYVYRWAEERAGPGAARATVSLLAAYPFAVYFSAPYSEAMFLLSVAATFVHFERMQWGRAAAWGFLSALVRPTGMLLVVPLAWLALRWRSRAARSLRFAAGMSVALAAPVLAVILHSLRIYALTGRSFAWSEAQVAWGRTYDLTTWLGLDLTRIAEQGVLEYVEAVPVTTLNVLGAAMALGLLYTVARRAGMAYALFVLVNLVPAIASGGSISLGRFTSTLFPVFFALAVLVPERRLPAAVAGFAIVQGLIAVLFFTWRPPF